MTRLTGWAPLVVAALLTATDARAQDLFGGTEIELAAGWEFGVAIGHCVTRSEPWLMKSTLGYAF